MNRLKKIIKNKLLIVCVILLFFVEILILTPIFGGLYNFFGKNATQKYNGLNGLKSFVFKEKLLKEEIEKPCLGLADKKDFQMAFAEQNRKGSKENLKEQVCSSFSTSYQTSGDNRKFNIRRALISLNGVVVDSGEQLSFNKAVGVRTKENGYKEAIVIEHGNYVKGYGGGVCQVSTTLYNAWLLAGLDVGYVQAHTLPPSYVDLSRDATVSSAIDLTLINSSNSPVKIKTSFTEQDITISICGNKKEYEYSLTSETLAVIHPEEKMVVAEGVEEKPNYIKGKDGYVSRLILQISKANRVIARREIRRDYYAPQNSIRIVKA